MGLVDVDAALVRLGVWRNWTSEDGSARSTVEVLAEELGPSLRWATDIPSRATTPA